jgi:hypothetical protein
VESNTIQAPERSGNNGNQTEWSQEPTARPEIVAKTQEVAGQLADQARQQVKSQLTQQKDRAAESLGSVAQALYTMGEQLRGQEQPAIAAYSDSIAETADRVFSYLADKDIDQLAGDVERFARRQPALFLTGAFALGFLASRFFKSSSPSNSYAMGASGYGTTELRSLPAPDVRVTQPTPTYSAPSAFPGTSSV